MILIGNQRGGGKNLAHHLLKEENDHVEVHELRGFASDNLKGAFTEAYAISRGTRCKQYLFSLSLNPPPGERVKTEDFRSAIDRIEERLGLQGQPRAIVFHEKEGRRHAHVVWSRIDAKEMKAVPLPFTKRKLQESGRELFLEHGWKMPKGFSSSRERDPKNFTLAEWQQAKRAGQDPRAIKADIQDSWAMSDSRPAFVQALKARGYQLARGDRRGFVAIDWRGEIYVVAKWAGVKTKQVRDRLGSESDLPSVAQAKAQIAKDMIPALERMRVQQERAAQEKAAALQERKKALVSAQREEREALSQSQAKRHAFETAQRQARFREGIKGVWDRLRGEHGRIRKLNEQEALLSLQQMRSEKDELVFKHLEQQGALGRAASQAQERQAERVQEIKKDIAVFNDMRPAAPSPPKERVEEFQRVASPEPQQSRPAVSNSSPTDRLAQLRQAKTPEQRLQEPQQRTPGTGMERE